MGGQRGEANGGPCTPPPLAPPLTTTTTLCANTHTPLCDVPIRVSQLMVTKSISHQTYAV